MLLGAIIEIMIIMNLGYAQYLMTGALLATPVRLISSLFDTNSHPVFWNISNPRAEAAHW